MKRTQEELKERVEILFKYDILKQYPHLSKAEITIEEHSRDEANYVPPSTFKCTVFKLSFDGQVERYQKIYDFHTVDMISDIIYYTIKKELQ